MLRFSRHCLIALALLGATERSARAFDDGTELAAWYEQAYAYYTAVIAGEVAKPDPAEWQAFMDQMAWASGQLGYDSSGWGAGGMSSGAEQVRLAYVGREGVADIYANEITLDIASVSAKVTVEQTSDTRFNPAEPVVKIIVTDPATGTQSVYFVHDYADAEIEINTPGDGQISGESKLLQIGRFVFAKPQPLTPKQKRKAKKARKKAKRCKTGAPPLPKSCPPP